MPHSKVCHIPHKQTLSVFVQIPFHPCVAWAFLHFGCKQVRSTSRLPAHFLPNLTCIAALCCRSFFPPWTSLFLSPMDRCGTTKVAVHQDSIFRVKVLQRNLSAGSWQLWGRTGTPFFLLGEGSCWQYLSPRCSTMEDDGRQTKREGHLPMGERLPAVGRRARAQTMAN